MEKDVAEEWNHRILRWEKARYSIPAALNPFAWTVRKRATLAIHALSGLVRPGDTLLELGCGSGILARRLLRLQFSRYQGYDSSALAVGVAQRRLARHPGGARCRFEVADLRIDGSRLEADLVFLFGLTDWLKAGELDGLLKRISSRALVLSYTETDAGLSIPFYRLYQWLRPRKTPREFPRCYAKHEIETLLASHGWTPAKTFRGGYLDPGRILVLGRD